MDESETYPNHGPVSFEKLREFEDKLRQLFPQDPPTKSVLGLLGLYLHTELNDSFRYWCTPPNCTPFASTGGQGVHFSFLERDGRSDDACPVVVTIPPSGGFNFIVGESLHDFLCFGSLRGFVALEQLPIELDLTLEAFTNPDWRPTEDWHEFRGFGIGEEHRPILEFMTSRFDLRPWPGPDRFHQLQKRLGGQIEEPDFDAQF